MKGKFGERHMLVKSSAKSKLKKICQKIVWICVKRNSYNEIDKKWHILRKSDKFVEKVSQILPKKCHKFYVNHVFKRQPSCWRNENAVNSRQFIDFIFVNIFGYFVQVINTILRNTPRTVINDVTERFLFSNPTHQSPK